MLRKSFRITIAVAESTRSNGRHKISRTRLAALIFSHPTVSDICYGGPLSEVRAAGRWWGAAVYLQAGPGLSWESHYSHYTSHYSVTQYTSHCGAAHFSLMSPCWSGSMSQGRTSRSTNFLTRKIIRTSRVWSMKSPVRILWRWSTITSSTLQGKPRSAASKANSTVKVKIITSP